MQYIEWSRPKKVKNATDDQKMMFGLFFSLNQFVAKMDPTGGADAILHTNHRALSTVRTAET